MERAFLVAVDGNRGWAIAVACEERRINNLDHGSSVPLIFLCRSGISIPNTPFAK
jgi:hypothetical protein